MLIKCNLEESVIKDLKDLTKKIYGEARVTQGFLLARLISETPREELITALREIPPRGGTKDAVVNISWNVRKDAADKLDEIASKLESSRTAAVRAVIRLAVKRYLYADDNSSAASGQSAEKFALVEKNDPREHFTDLKDFIRAEKPWEFNFDLLTKNEKFKNIRNAFERYISYKATAMDPGKRYVYPHVGNFVSDRSKDCQGVYDPDGWNFEDHYHLIWEIYGILWGWHSQENFNGSAYGKIAGVEGCRFGADSMNSIQNTLRRVIDDMPVEKRANPKGFTNSKAYFIECYLGENNEEFRKAIDTPLINEYINSFHTLGNFVLVPAGFNGFRGTNNTIGDFWNRSLRYLKEEGYKDKRFADEYGEFKPEAFNRYINRFFLWDHVAKNANGYCVKSANIENMSEFFETTVKKIKLRGMFMTAMLMIAARGKYHTLQEKIFNSDECYDGFCDIIEQIEAANIDLTDEEFAILNDIAENEDGEE